MASVAHMRNVARNLEQHGYGDEQFPSGLDELGSLVVDRHRTRVLEVARHSIEFE